MLKRIIFHNSIMIFITLLMFNTSASAAKTLIDYFLPMPIVKEPLRSDKWGCAAVGKRDIYNGIEDTANKSYSYWDGPIIKTADGKYHMYASRWDQAGGHWSWMSSVGIHAVSESVMGPYVDKGMTWPSDQNGKGHNLTILELKDGTYASVVSDTRQGDFFTAPTVDGPWKFAGTININANGFSKPSHIANLSIIIRPDDGRYMIVERGGQIMISSGGLTGPYLIQGKSVYNTVNLPNLEDPVLWYSGGYYHIVVNSWSEKKAFHLRSKDGIKDWTNEGLAFDPRSDFLRYTDGTVNHWAKIERPGVYIENGHITHWTFAVIDSEKDNDKGNDSHNSKVIIVPFDGAAFDGEVVPENRDTIYNGKFDKGTGGWTLNVWNGSATGSVVNGEYRISITDTAEDSYGIQLVQSGLILEKGKSYKVSFDAYASSVRSLDVNVEMKDDPWTSYLSAQEKFELSAEKKNCSFVFEMEQPSDSSARLSFNAGASTEAVTIDNVTIKQIDETANASVIKRSTGSESLVKYNSGNLEVCLNNDKYGKISMNILNLKGAVIQKNVISSGLNRGKYTSCLSGLPCGVYFVNLVAGDKTICSSRFVHRN